MSDNHHETDMTGLDLLIASALRDDVPPGVESRLVRGLDEFRPPAQQPLSLWRRPVIFRWALAAVLVIAAALGLSMLGGTQPSLYAQTTQALAHTRTAHVVVTQLTDGKPVVIQELWYDRERGLRTFVMRDGTPHITLSDGENDWEYDPGANRVVKTSTTSHPDLSKALDDTFNTREMLDIAKRDAAGDRIIDGVACQMYVVPSDPAQRNLVWLDPDKRVRRAEQNVLRDGKWSNGEFFADVSYDAPIDVALFEPRFGGAKVIEAATLTQADTFPLEKAIFVKRTMGMIVAVHEVQRVEGIRLFLDNPGQQQIADPNRMKSINRVLVVYSTRPDEETVRQYGRQTVTGNRKYEAHVTIEQASGTHRWYVGVDLGTYEADGGLQVTWALLTPHGFWPEELETCPLDLHIWVGGKLGDALDAKGQETSRDFFPLVQLPLPQPTFTIDEALNRSYAQLRKLDKGNGEFSRAMVMGMRRPLTLEEKKAMKVPESDTTGTMRTSQRLSTMKLEEYIADMKNELKGD